MAQDITRAIKVYLDSSQYAQSLKSMEAELEGYRSCNLLRKFIYRILKTSLPNES